VHAAVARTTDVRRTEVADVSSHDFARCDGSLAFGMNEQVTTRTVIEFAAWLQIKAALWRS